MSDALAISRAYYEAWAAKDFDTAMTYLADDVIGLTPSGRLDGAEAFRGFMEPFTRIVTSTGLVAAFGDDRTSVLLYDTATLPVPDAPGAECHTVVDGRITEIRIVFDRLPFSQARETGAAAG